MDRIASKHKGKFWKQMVNCKFSRYVCTSTCRWNSLYSRQIRRRSNNRGSYTVNQIFNRTYSAWKRVLYYKVNGNGDISYDHAGKIRSKIRNLFLRGGGPANIIRLEIGKISYKQAKKLHGREISLFSRNLDCAYTILQVTEDGWASECFIHDVFKITRKQKKAGPTWIPN